MLHVKFGALRARPIPNCHQPLEMIVFKLAQPLLTLDLDYLSTSLSICTQSGGEEA